MNTSARYAIPVVPPNTAENRALYDKIVPYAPLRLLVDSGSLTAVDVGAEVAKCRDMESGRQRAYLWDRLFTGRIFSLEGADSSSTEVVMTVHRWNHCAYFKPDLVEVMSQMPESIRTTDKAYIGVTTTYSGTLDGELYGYHLGQTTYVAFDDFVDNAGPASVLGIALRATAIASDGCDMSPDGNRFIQGL